MSRWSRVTSPRKKSIAQPPRSHTWIPRSPGAATTSAISRSCRCARSSSMPRTLMRPVRARQPDFGVSARSPTGSSGSEVTAEDVRLDDAEAVGAAAADAGDVVRLVVAEFGGQTRVDQGTARTGHRGQAAGQVHRRAEDVAPQRQHRPVRHTDPYVRNPLIFADRLGDGQADLGARGGALGAEED